MAKFILGKKLNMTQKFTEDGLVMPVTAVSAGPCTVVQVKGEKDGYKAIQVAYGNKKKINKPMAGHLKGLDNFRYLREFRTDNIDNFARGKVYDVTSFQVGDILEVRAISKGKGFQGVVKRHGFHGSPATHGHKDQLRMPGSIGATDAARVFKGTRMAGRMGGDNVTVKNLELVEIDAANNILYIKGAVPGPRGSFVEITAPGEIVFIEKTKITSQDEPIEEVKEQGPNKEKIEEVKTETSVVEGAEKAQEEPKEDKKSTENKKEQENTEEKK